MKKRKNGEVLPFFPQENKEEVDIPKDWIEDMVGALTDPLIIWPGPWGADLPAWIREQLSIARLLHLMKCSKGLAKWDECTELEALAYMYPRTFEEPMTHDWAEIYVYLGYQVIYVQQLGLVKRENYAEDMKKDKLSRDQERDLRDLRRFIQRKKVEARKARRRGEKIEGKKLEREEKESQVEKHEQQALFQF